MSDSATTNYSRGYHSDEEEKAAKDKILILKKDQGELMEKEKLDDLNEWYTRLFILLLKNSDAMSSPVKEHS